MGTGNGSSLWAVSLTCWAGRATQSLEPSAHFLRQALILRGCCRLVAPRADTVGWTWGHFRPALEQAISGLSEACCPVPGARPADGESLSLEARPVGSCVYAQQSAGFPPGVKAQWHWNTWPCQERWPSPPGPGGDAVVSWACVPRLALYVLGCFPGDGVPSGTLSSRACGVPPFPLLDRDCVADPQGGSRNVDCPVSLGTWGSMP